MKQTRDSITDIWGDRTPYFGDWPVHVDERIWWITQEVQLGWIVLDQAAKALRDKELQTVGEQCSQTTKRQSGWLMTRMKQAAPQILVVAT